MTDKKMKRTPPSVDQWLREAKNESSALEEGMFLIHNGIVRQTTKAKVRSGIENGLTVKAMEFFYDTRKVDMAIEEAFKLDGIFHIKVWLNEGYLEVGDDIMYVLIGGDIRPNVINALQFLVEKIKSECVTEVEIV